MDFDPTMLVATPKDWLETQAHYEGAARAEFANPPGAIEGQATICVNSVGRCAHFAAHSHPTGRMTWRGVLTHYRAAATHDAYFDWAQREDLYTIVRVRDHLHDLLLRVLFKTVRYDGPYQSPIPPLMQTDSVDYVTPQTAAGMLGYA